MKDKKITVVFDNEDAKKFQSISEKSKWTDKFIISTALNHYYKKFSLDWKKAVIEALEGGEKDVR